METKEWVKMWRDPALDGLEGHHATYITHRFARHMHDYYVIGVIERGVQAFSSRGVRHITPLGGVFVINPGEAHTGEAANEGGYTYRTLYPDLGLVQRAASAIAWREHGVPFFPTSVIADLELARSIRGLHLAFSSSQSQLERESRFLQTFAILITRYAEHQPSEHTVGHERKAIQQMRCYLDEHYTQRVSLTDLAQLVGFSPYYLLRVFEQEVGIPPHAYRESVRIREAQRFLAQGMPLVQVAYELGFSHQSHLTNRFKRFLGITPGQYAQHHKVVEDTGLFFGGARHGGTTTHAH